MYIYVYIYVCIYIYIYIYVYIFIPGYASRRDSQTSAASSPKLCMSRRWSGSIPSLFFTRAPAPVVFSHLFNFQLSLS